MSVSSRRAPDRRPDEGARRAVARLVQDLPDADKVPRREGDLAFDAPWQVRALGLTVELHQQGRFPWPDFQSELVAAIDAWEAAPERSGDWSYYRHWVEALERLVTTQGLLDRAAIDARTEEFRSGARDPKHAAPAD